MDKEDSIVIEKKDDGEKVDKNFNILYPFSLLLFYFGFIGLIIILKDMGLQPWLNVLIIVSGLVLITDLHRSLKAYVRHSKRF